LAAVAFAGGFGAALAGAVFLARAGFAGVVLVVVVLVISDSLVVVDLFADLMGPTFGATEKLPFALLRWLLR
jgi:hypothetical protein